MAASSKQHPSAPQRDYFDLASPASSSPSSTPGGHAQEWGPPSTPGTRTAQLSGASGLGGRYQPRRGSTASSVASVGPWEGRDVQGRLAVALGSASANAISTLLQPPIVRTGLLPHTSAPASSAHRPPSTRDIPPVTLTNIPHVEPAVFRPYLAQVGSLYEARARADPTADGGSDDKAAEETPPPQQQHHHDNTRQQRPGQGSRQGPSGAPLSPPPPAESPQTSRKRGSSGRRRLEVTPLSTIPTVYFDENFHLENPRTFDVVSERSEVVRTPVTPAEEGGRAANGSANGDALAPPRKALATNAILQEKLSWYLDTVEIHLISSISAASQSFFAALGSLKELHSEAADSVTKIKKLRQDLAQLDKEMAMGGLEIVAMKQRRENLRKLSDSVDQLRNVVTGATHCEELVDEGELEMALDHIAVLEEYTCGRLRARAEDVAWLTTNPQLHLRDLRRLKALSGFAEGMDQLRAKVGKAYEMRFLDALLQDLRHHIATVPTHETAKRWAHASLRARGHASAPSVVPAYLQTNSQLRQNLSVILHGLSRSKSLTIASAAFRDAIMREMKALIRKHLPSSSDDDAESVASVSTTRSRVTTQADKSARLARNLRMLGADDAEELLMKMYCGVGEALRRLQTQVKMLLDVTSAQVLSPTAREHQKSPPRTPNIDSSIDRTLSPPTQTRNRPRSDSTPLQEELMQALDLSSLLGQAVDAAHSQITKILKVRAEQSISLSLTHFLRYFSLNRMFADECEAISGRSGAALKNVVNVHITGFIAEMARSEREAIERGLDAEVWAAVSFAPKDEVVLAQVMQGMSSDPPQWLAQAYVWEEFPTPKLNGTTNGTDTPPALPPGTSKEQPTPALIDDEKFILVPSAMALLHTLSRYQTLISCIPSITPDVSREITEYLKFFNSRSCQLVLGAGATRSTAALPNINTKHLALVSQTLGFVVGLVPYVREFVRRRPGMSHEKMGEFDKVRRLYQDHQVSINEKLVDIMSGRCARHVKVMVAVDFDDDASDTGGVSKHMEQLVKETVVLQRTLGRYLPPHHVRGILVPVFALFREQWGSAFKGARITTQAGKERLVRDAEYFESKLGKMDGVGDTGQYLLGIAREKSVAAPAPTPIAAPIAAPTAAPATATGPVVNQESSSTSTTTAPTQQPEVEETAPALPARSPSTPDVVKIDGEDRNKGENKGSSDAAVEGGGGDGKKGGEEGK